MQLEPVIDTTYGGNWFTCKYTLTCKIAYSLKVGKKGLIGLWENTKLTPKPQRERNKKTIKQARPNILGKYARANDETSESSFKMQQQHFFFFFFFSSH